MSHLKDFVATRAGVEMYVEPRTTVTPTTIVLIATNGEWTRRRIADERAAGGLANIIDRVSALDGEVTIDSPPGKGTRLTLRIPCG